jgi:hypothetical protein
MRGFRVYDHLMGVGAAFSQGWHRVWRARLMMAGILLATALLAVAAPVAGGAALGPASRSIGLALAAAIEVQLAAIDLPHAPVVAVIAHLTVSLVLLGALLARLAADRPLGVRACVTAGLVRAFRFLRLGLVGGLASLLAAAILFASPNAVGAYLSLALLFIVSLFVSYAEIRLVIEDRRTILGALVAGARFVRAHPGATLGLHMLNALVCGVAFLPLIWLAPPPAGTVGLDPVTSTLALLPVVVVQLQWTASQVALFQDRLGAADV